jgi:hypothetical protein
VELIANCLQGRAHKWSVRGLRELQGDRNAEKLNSLWVDGWVLWELIITERGWCATKLLIEPEEVSAVTRGKRLTFNYPFHYIDCLPSAAANWTSLFLLVDGSCISFFRLLLTLAAAGWKISVTPNAAIFRARASAGQLIVGGVGFCLLEAPTLVRAAPVRDVFILLAENL